MISVFGSSLGEGEINAVADVMRRQWLGVGSQTLAFEEQFAKRLGLPNMVLVNSGSNALYMAVHLLELPPNSEVILPSFTWVSCAHAIKLAGHTPVFCDVDLISQNVTADTIRTCITPRTAAIMVVHYAGKAVDLDPILALGYPVIEDAAHAVDTYYKGKTCGSMGDIGMYSFDAIKNLTMGEGGGLTLRDESLVEKARKLRYCGIGKSGFQQAQQSAHSRWWEYNIAEVFIKTLPTDLSAAIGLVQLQRLDEMQVLRKKVWDKYQEAFEGHGVIQTPANPAKDETHSYFTYLIRVPRRDELAHYLYEHGIYSTLRYHPLHLNAIYNYEGHLPVTEELNETGLNIPLHAMLKDEEVQLVIDKILGFYL